MLRLRHALLAASLATPAAAQTPSATSPCAMAPADSVWAARALAGWDWTARALLRLPAPDAPATGVTPWIVLFDSRCTWHLGADAGDSTVRGAVPITVAAGRTLAGVPHGDAVALPTGATAPVRVTAFTAPLGRADRAMLVLALPSVWRAVPRHAENAQLDALVLGVFMHEAAHTRQAVPADRMITEIGRATPLPEDLDDDIVQRRFGERAGYRDAYEKENALLWRAVEARDAATRLALAREAAVAMRARRARWFVGADSAYAALEDVFLSLEGVGNWTALGFMRAREGLGLDPALALDRIRGGRKSWTQEEGLALYLVLDALRPGWQPRALSAQPTSGRELLEEATGLDRGR